MTRTTLNLVLGILLVGLLIAYGLQRRALGRAAERAVAAGAAADSLARVADSLRGAYHTDTVAFHHWHTAWDTLTLPGRIDSVPVPVLVAVADSTIRACEAVVRTCEQRVAVERERADSWQVAAQQWRKVARGPWIQPRLELTVTPQLQPEAAAELTVGRTRLRLLARAEVGQEAAARVGISWWP